MHTVVRPHDLCRDQWTVAEIDTRLVNDWLLDFVPDERRILDRCPDHPRWAAKLDEANERAVASLYGRGHFDEREIWCLMARLSLFALRGAHRPLQLGWHCKALLPDRIPKWLRHRTKVRIRVEFANVRTSAPGTINVSRRPDVMAARKASALGWRAALRGGSV